MKKDSVIPFYGANQRELFNIERQAMDRPGKVINFLNQNLKKGHVLDIGAGDGYTAAKILNSTVFCLEPAPGMINRANSNIWIKGSAENLPFHDDYFDSVYSTWAYFLQGVEKQKGLDQAIRVCKPGGRIIIIDNAGDDEFCSFATTPIHEGPEFYINNGFDLNIIDTCFEFDTLEESERLMKTFFPSIKKDQIKLKYEYRVAAYTLDLEK